MSEKNLQVNITSPSQHSGNKSKDNRIITVSLLPDFGQGKSNTIEHLNKVKLHVRYIKLNLSKVSN